MDNATFNTQLADYGFRSKSADRWSVTIYDPASYEEVSIDVAARGRDMHIELQTKLSAGGDGPTTVTSFFVTRSKRFVIDFVKAYKPNMV